MNIKNLNIGELNQRCTYTMAGTSVSDGIGGYTVTDGTSVTTWCGVQPMKMSEVLHYGLADGSQPCYFGFYYEQGRNLQQGGDITFNSVVYRIQSVVNIDQENDMVVVFAVKKV